MIPWLTEDRIHQHASERSYERGMRYYKSGDVLSVIKRGTTIQAFVEGSEYSPYSVQITFDSTNFTTCSCSCPYNYGDYCKHLVAVLLTCMHSPEEVQEKPSLEAVLDTMDADALKKLILKLAHKSPELFAERIPGPGISRTVFPRIRVHAGEPGAYQRSGGRRFATPSLPRTSPHACKSVAL